MSETATSSGCRMQLMGKQAINKLDMVGLISIPKHTDNNTGQWFCFPTTGTNRNVPECATGGPVTVAAFAKVPRLISVVVVEVTELCLHALASRTCYDLVRTLLHRRIG